MALTSRKYPEKIDLDNCAKEPIHIIGKTQEYGVILVCDPLSLKITQAGANSLEYFSIAGNELLDEPLARLLGEEQVSFFKDKLAVKDTALPLQVKVNGKDFLLLAHFSGINLVLEFEPLEEVSDSFFFQKHLTRILNKLQASGSIAELCRSAALLTQQIFGYDRVMIYKFDEEWNGEVVAERKAPEMESWLGLKYPATDIPPQSRALFLKNRVRMIADVHYTPQAILPEISPLTEKPLDLSHLDLRAVSPIHIEYLINMEVGASMTSAIVVGGKLWGLIACHHRTAKFISYYQRESARFLAEMFSTKIALQESNNFIKNTEVSEKIRNQLVEQIRERNGLFEALAEGPVKFTDLISCSGGALYFQGEWKFCGSVPEKEKMDSLLQNFLARKEENLFFTRKLSELFPEADSYKKKISGLLSLRLAEDKYILWLRPEEVENVNWGGDPANKAFYDEEKKRLSPRKSFSKWSEQVTGVSKAFKDYDISVVKTLGENISHILLARQRHEIEALNEKLLEANKELELFSYGLSHDLRAPIRGLEGYLQILTEDYGHSLDEDGQKLLKMGSDLIQKTHSLIDDILSYSRISQLGALQLQEIPVKDLINEFLEMINVRANYPHTRLMVQEDLPAMKGDRRMLLQLWSNLISNALKYSAQKENPEVQIGMTIKNGEQVYFISDNGIGIDEKDFGQIFESFTRVAGKDFKGSGIGLAIVKKIIDKHRGEIWVESAGNEGTTFYFYTNPGEGK
ncbi:ATP-binding protein [Salinimicrobium catena]|uniref:ATP-binding protein n=1 Tax=Salinimicrobium catena TaxID=390640 RepID=UPI002FE46001